MNQDEQHLRLLSIFHYVLGGLLALFSCFPIIHLILGVIMIVSPGTMETDGEPPPAFIGWIFTLFAVAIIMAGWTLAACIIIAGRFLHIRKRYVFCIVIAGIECIFMPLGTVLGVFTIIVLMRESVKQMFSSHQT